MKPMTMKRTRTHLAAPMRSKQSNAMKSNLPEHTQKDNFHENIQNHTQNLIEKYTILAREALTSGDRVLAESFYQLAEHYLRLNNDKESIVTLSKNERKPRVQKRITVPNDFEMSIEQELAIAQSKL